MTDRIDYRCPHCGTTDINNFTMGMVVYMDGSSVQSTRCKVCNREIPTPDLTRSSDTSEPPTIGNGGPPSKN